MANSYPTRDLTGQQFGRLKVIEFAFYRNDWSQYWKCRCDCGKITIAPKNNLVSNKQKSCGCWRRERGLHLTRTGFFHPRISHGHCIGNPTRTYGTWRAMMNRCYVKKQKSYKHYGGRGINVCERWHRFENFLADMGERPPGKTIERRNNDHSYTPENCVWADPKTQTANRRINNR